jgi:hypothetical protein
MGIFGHFLAHFVENHPKIVIFSKKRGIFEEMAQKQAISY